MSAWIAVGTAAAHMILIFGGYRMQDADTLGSYGVHHASNISMSVSLRGC